MKMMFFSKQSDGGTPGQHALLRAATGLYLAAMMLVSGLGFWPLALGAVGLVYAGGWQERSTAMFLALLLFVIGILEGPDFFVMSLGLALLLRAFHVRLGFTWLLLAACFAASAVVEFGTGSKDLLLAYVLFAGLALARGPHPWSWLAMFVAAIALALFIRDFSLNWAPVLLLGFAFDPAWIRPRAGPRPLTVYYDGTCGFCHRGVLFLLREDRDGSALRFAPLQGSSFANAVPEAQRADLPDSIVVREPGGVLRVRSDGALLIGGALGGLWRPLAALARLIPRFLRDAVYNGIARVRGRLFRKPEGLCPLLPKEWMSRFDPE